MYDRHGGANAALAAKGEDIKGEASGPGMSLDSIIDKKRIYQQTKVLMSGQENSVAAIFEE